MTKTTRRQAPKPETQLKGLPFYNPVAIELRYSRELRALTRVMTKETDAAVRALFKSPDAKEFFAMDASIAIQAREMMNLLTIRFQHLFNSHAERMARRMVGAVDEQSRVALERSFKKLAGELTIKATEIPPALKTIYEASISENVDLIKSIPEQYMGRIKGAVNRSITGTGGIGPLVTEIKKYGGMSDRRAKNIALDQTRKAMQSASIERSKSAGVKKGIWVHTGGTKEPRPKHKAYNGNEFNLAEGAPVGDKGQNVQPGEEPFCRCTFIPVVDFEDL
jgi:SPP1 gp7 family putative phage head morphogenesis protein